MLKSIFVVFVLITLFSSVFAGNPETSTEVLTLKRYSHNPYRRVVAPSTNTVPSPSVTIVDCPRNSGHRQVANPSAETTSSSSQVTAKRITQNHVQRIWQEIDRLGQEMCSHELTRKYEDLISYCKQISQCPNQLQAIKLDVQSATAYTLLGLSNVYGRMRDNQRKFETGRDAFLLCAELHRTSPNLLIYGRNIEYRAGTCIYAMNQAVYYMFEGVGPNDTAAQKIYEESLELIRIHIKEGNSKSVLLESFGYERDIRLSLNSLALKF